MEWNQITFLNQIFVLKSNHHQRFNHDLNQIIIWIWSAAKKDICNIIVIKLPQTTTTIETLETIKVVLHSDAKNNLTNILHFHYLCLLWHLNLHYTRHGHNYVSNHEISTETLTECTYNVVNIFTGNVTFLHSFFKKVNSQFQTKVLFLQLWNLLQIQCIQ